MPIKLNGATNGSVELDVPAAVGSDLQITLPATAGTAIVKAADGSVDLGSVDIDSSGRVGIGTSSPSGKLDILTGTTGNVLIDAEGGSNFHAKIVNDSGDLVVGARSTSADTIVTSKRNTVFKTGSSEDERLRIDSSGNVGIGSTNPLSKFQVRPTADVNLGIANSSARASISAYNDAGSANIPLQIVSSETKFVIGNSDAAIIDSSGRLLLGLSSSIGGNALLQVQGSGNRKAHFHQPDTGSCITQFTNSTTGSGSTDGLLVGLDSTEDGMLWLYENQNLTFATNNTERMRIDSSGSVLVGRSTGIGDDASLGQTQVYRSGTNDKYALAVHHDGNNSANYGIYVSCGQDSGNGFPMRIHDGNGSLVGSISFSGSSTAFNTSSDYRLKENVIDIADGITRVKQLLPKRFNFIVNADKTVDGFLAHEAQAVVPEAVTGEKDGEEMQGIDQSKLVPLLTAALQEAITKIETLEARVTTLEAG